VEPHRKKPPRRGICLRWVLLSVALPLGLVYADEPGPADRPDARITSNQSVSIDEPETPGQLPGVGEAADSVPDPATPTEEGPDARVIPRPERSTAAPGVFARPATGGQVGGEGAARAVPWYRSGLGALTLVLVLIVAVYWLVRRYLPAARAGDSGVLRVVARTGLTPKQSLMLIRLPRRFVLVAVSQNRVDTLCAIDNEEEVADLFARVHAPVPGKQQQFEGLLQAEEAEYDEAEVAAAARSHGAGRVSSEALTGLLVKLRALTSKN